MCVAAPITQKPQQEGRGMLLFIHQLSFSFLEEPLPEETKGVDCGGLCGHHSGLPAGVKDLFP